MTKQDYFIFSSFFDVKDVMKCPEYAKFLRGEMNLDEDEELALCGVVERVMDHFMAKEDVKAKNNT
jgi:hypothetical protein